MMTSVRQFATEEDGVSTIEAALWFPVIFFVTLLAADAVFIALNHARLQRVVDESNRAISVGEVETCDELVALMTERLGNMASSAVPACSADGTYVTATLTVSSGDLDLSGASGVLDGFTVRAQSEMTTMNGLYDIADGGGTGDTGDTGDTGTGDTGTGNGNGKGKTK